MIIADRNIITLRKQKPNAVFAHCQQRILGVLCPVVSLPTNFCLSDSASALRYQHAEARAREGHLTVSTRKGCIRSTAYWIRKACATFFLPLVFDRVRDVSN